jgi:protocatechuate 3,4-dioxygenase beta subunit
MCYVLFVACCGWDFVRSIRGQVPLRQDGVYLRSEETGSIKGHVYCGDINVPARLASVTIQSASSVGIEPNQAATGSSPESTLPISIKTDLDGNFTMMGVKPGKYVVVAWLPGYLSPLARLALETDKFGGPSEGFKHSLEQLVPSVIVDANQTSSVDIRLERGAEISGTVSYDDGGPVVGAEVELLQQTKNAEWRLVPLSNSLVTFRNGNTDDRGRFRLVGVPPGRYIISAALPLETFWGAGIDRGSVRYAMPRTLKGKLEVYSGDALRKSHATSIEIASGETRPGTDITIPLSKLHRIAGVLSAANDGHPLRSGLVELLYADDLSVAQRAHVDEDGTFLINFVMNGDYILKVTGGTLDDEGGATQSSSRADASGRHRNPTYKGIDMLLSVHGDINNLVVALNE